MSAIPASEPELVMTEAEYLAFEEASDTKHEFVDGHVYDWPGYEYGATPPRLGRQRCAVLPRLPATTVWVGPG